MRAEPSAAALAGSGPTTTYPAPPSASAIPEAIASIAGGTAASRSTSPDRIPGPGSATAQVAGFDVSPGYATPASDVSSTNLAAAQANGIYSGAKSAGYGAPSAPQTTASEYKPSGYSFGSAATTPKPASPPTSTVPDSPSAYAKASSFTPPPGSFATQATSFTPPATGSSYTTPPPTGSSGYTLPTDSPAVAAITQPTASKSAASPADESANAFAPPAAAGPDFSTASTASVINAPNASTDDSSVDSNSGYSPGSTGAAVGYPSGNVTPTTTGSFYR